MSRIPAPSDRPVPTKELILATQQTSETESIQKDEVTAGGAHVPGFVTGGIDSAESHGGNSASIKDRRRDNTHSGQVTLGSSNSRVGARDMSHVGSSFTTTYPGGYDKTVTTEKGTTTRYYVDGNDKPYATHEKSIEEGVKTTKTYDANGVYTGKTVESFDGVQTSYDKNGKKKDFATEEDGNLVPGAYR